MQARWVPLVPRDVAFGDRAVAGLLGCALGSRQVEVVFGTDRQHVTHTWVCELNGSSSQTFAFFFFSPPVMLFELPYALLVMFQSRQIRQRKPDN